MRLYLKFFAMHLKSRMAYKRSFFFSIVGQFMTAFTAFLALSFLFQRFGTVRGYTYGETLLCASVTLTSFALAESLFRGFDRFPAIFIRNAEFDRILVRPRGLIFQVLCQEIEFSRLGKLLQSLLMLGVGISRSPVVWSAGKAALLAAMVLGLSMFLSTYLVTFLQAVTGVSSFVGIMPTILALGVVGLLASLVVALRVRKDAAE